MSEDKTDKESKTEQPTEHKIRETLKKGNMPVSRELTVFAAFSSLAIIAYFVAIPSFGKLTGALFKIFERPEDWPLTTAEDTSHLFVALGKIVSLAVAPIFIIIMITGLSSYAIQNAPRFIGERIKPKGERISLRKGLQRIFSKSGFIEFLKSFAKLLGASIISYIILFKNDRLFTDAFFMPPSQLPHFIRQEIVRLLFSLACGTAVIAGLDLAWTRYNWRAQLRMSRHEIKKEHKELEGDPLVKARMQSLSRDRIRRQMISDVPKATLIVANPTHFSVALRYNPPEDFAPVVIAKGQNILALKIREIAVENDIPVIENVPLARALYKQVEINQVIPEEFYQAVAALIRYINNR